MRIKNRMILLIMIFGPVLAGAQAHENFSQLFQLGTVGAWKKHDCNPLLSQPKQYSVLSLDSSNLSRVAPIQRSRFGGAMNLPRVLTAANRFRTYRSEHGRWSFVDPDGYVFLSTGINTVSNSTSNENEKISWAKDTKKMMEQYGFNTLGAWSADVEGLIGSRQDSLARTPVLHLLHHYHNESARNRRDLDEAAEQVRKSSLPETSKSSLVTSKHLQLALLFLPKREGTRTFEEFARARSKDIVGNTPAERRIAILGYFTDNELPFYVDLIDLFLRLEKGHPARTAVEKFLMTEIKNPDIRWQIRQYLNQNVSNRLADETRYAFLKYVAGIYYSTVHDAVRAADPDRLILGTRVHVHRGALSRRDEHSSFLNHPALFEAQAPYVDVVSINYYNTWVPSQDLMKKWVEFTQHSKNGKVVERPFLISEFEADGRDQNVVIPDEDGVVRYCGYSFVVQTQAERGLFYQNFALNVMRANGSVGWHWFVYRDRVGKANGGTVNESFQPYTTFLSAAKWLNDRTTGLRWRTWVACQFRHIRCVDGSDPISSDFD